MNLDLTTWAMELTADVHKKWKQYHVTQPDFFNSGYAVFYSPIKETPDLLVIGYNPGGDSTSFNEETAQNLPSGHDYFISEYPMANKMVSLFKDIGQEKLLRESVKTNFLFFRSRGEDDLSQLDRKVRDELFQFCERKIEDIVKTLRPKIILAEGIATFDLLRKTLRLTEADYSLKPKNQRVFVENKTGPIRLLGIIHPTGSQATTEELAEMKRALSEALRS